MVESAVENVQRECTLSGVPLQDDETLQYRLGVVASYLWVYSQSFLDYFWRAHGKENASTALRRALGRADAYSELGDFLNDEVLDDIAAFGLLQIDRLVQTAMNSPDGPPGWRTLAVYDQITECNQYVLVWQMQREMTSPTSGVGPLQKLANKIVIEQNRRAGEIGQQKRYSAGREIIKTYLIRWREQPALYRSLDTFAEDMREKQDQFTNARSIKNFVTAMGGCPTSKVKNY